MKYYGYGERKSYKTMNYKVDSSTSNTPLVTPQIQLGPEIQIEK